MAAMGFSGICPPPALGGATASLSQTHMVQVPAWIWRGCAFVNGAFWLTVLAYCHAAKKTFGGVARQLVIHAIFIRVWIMLGHGLGVTLAVLHSASINSFISLVQQFTGVAFRKQSHHPPCSELTAVRFFLWSSGTSLPVRWTFRCKPTSLGPARWMRNHCCSTYPLSHDIPGTHVPTKVNHSSSQKEAIKLTLFSWGELKGYETPKNSGMQSDRNNFQLCQPKGTAKINWLQLTNHRRFK